MDTAVSIIGAGHCGCAFAADLLDRGIRVLLHADPAHSQDLRAIQTQGSLRAAARIEGDFHPVLSMEIEDAVRFSKTLVVTVPAYAHDGVITWPSNRAGPSPDATRRRLSPPTSGGWKPCAGPASWSAWPMDYGRCRTTWPNGAANTTRNGWVVWRWS